MAAPRQLSLLCSTLQGSCSPSPQHNGFDIKLNLNLPQLPVGFTECLLEPECSKSSRICFPWGGTKGRMVALLPDDRAAPLLG